MTFTYRHKKQIIIIVILSALLLVLGGFVFYKFSSTTKSEDKLVIKTSKEDIKKEKEEDTADIYYQVDIKGEVNVPGIYTVKENSRVIDVIRLAGDLTENADTSVLNLSKKVVDEMVIIVYSYDEVANFTETLEKEKAEQEACLNQNEITNDAYFYSITVLVVLLLAIDLIATTTFDGTVLALFDAIYMVLFARYVYLYGCFLDNKEKKINPTTSIEEIKEKVEEVKERLDDVVDDIQDKVEGVVKEVTDDDSKKKKTKKSSKTVTKKTEKGKTKKSKEDK